jgi:hypothetical protein
LPSSGRSTLRDDGFCAEVARFRTAAKSVRTLLDALVKADSTNPPGNEARVAISVRSASRPRVHIGHRVRSGT